MFSEVAIETKDISKCYQIFDTPRARLKQFVLPKMQKALGRKIDQHYREFWSLQGISLRINKGETVGIIGRNGSGKSTLLQIICGTLAPTSGTLTTNGRIAALLELGAGFNPEFTGRENVLLNAAILGFSKEAFEERMSSVLEFSELGDFLDQPVKTYSSGMYSRLAFSACIHLDPEILIVDEALAVGDARFVAKCMRRIKEIQSLGTTILFVSHDVSSVRTLCNRSIWLEQGRVVNDGDVFPITGKYMEFMFKDEDSLQTLQEAPGKNPITSDETLDTGRSDRSTKKPEAELSASQSSETDHGLDSRPITHWGSRKGLILGASVCDSAGLRSDVIKWNEPIRVVLDLFIPADISREHLSIAFSIKDLKGTDLIVSTTHDICTAKDLSKERFSISFQMLNPLVTGKYLLVAAVENRFHHDIHYYEYLEGAHYFSSLTERRFFGIFQPEISQSIHNA